MAYTGPIGPSLPGYLQGTANNVLSNGTYSGPIGPSSPGYVQGTANNVSVDSSGGGGNNNTGNPYDNIQPSGPSQDEINGLFNSTFDVLNQAEGNLRGQLPGLISEAEQQAAASRSLLEGSKDTQNELLGQQENRVNRVGQTQTADQRRILQELTQANQQKFGGASSAGQAASEIQGREFQRSRFGIQQNVQEGLQQINQQRQQIQREFQQGLQQLQVNTQQAINEINRRFQDKLLEINAKKAETEQAKAQARLQALQDLRNQAYQINVARAQFEADLKSQAQSNSQYLDTAQNNLLSYGQAGVNAGNNAAAYQTTGIPSVAQSTTGTTNPQFTGQISRNEDLTGQIGLPSRQDLLANQKIFA